jgi:ABC-type thiamine transport system substrate-binding protein
MRIYINKICKDKDRIWNKIKMDFEKMCKCSFKFLKNGDASSTTMLILQQNHKKQNQNLPFFILVNNLYIYNAAVA